MTFEQIEEWVVGAVIGTISALAAAVRHNDLQRVSSLEARIDEQEEQSTHKLDALRAELQSSNKDLREEMRTNYASLRSDIESKHSQLVGILLGMKGRQE